MWEPIVWGLALGNTQFFDNYVAGLTFILIFIAAIALMRIGTDMLIENNLKLPPMADLVGGFATGAVAGVIAVGMMMVGTGFLQRPQEFMGYKGYGRETTGNAEIGPLGPSLWLPADKITTGFYELASVTGLRPDISSTPLRQYNPELYKQASLVRDTFMGDKGQVYLVPKGAEVGTPLEAEYDGKRYITVPVKFDASSRDFGRQLTLSKSQIRLVGRTRGLSPAPIAYPSYWVQDTGSGDTNDIFPGFYRFDDASNYVTSVPGREKTNTKLIFEVDDNFRPLFIQLKGTRLKLAEPTEQAFLTTLAGAMPLGAGQEFEEEPGGDITAAVKIGGKLRFLRSLSKNKMPSSMGHSDGYLTEGYMKIRGGGKASRINRGLQIKGVAQTEGTTIVQVDISRNSPANLFNIVRKQAKQGDRISLTDTDGNSYAPMGMYYRGRDGTEVRLDRKNFLRTMEDLGAQPASGSTQEMKLLFEVTNGSTLDELYLGNIMVGYIEGVATRP